MKKKLSNTQKEILDGLMLGDGNLSRTTFGNARLRINRAYKDIEYSKWIFNKFKIFCTKNLYRAQAFLIKEQIKLTRELI